MFAPTQSSISEEAKEVYNSLVDRPGLCEPLPYRSEPDPPVCEPEPAEHNPLRMLRAGVTVRPKIRGNKHNFNSGFSTIERSHGTKSGAKDGHFSVQNSNNFDFGTHQTLPKGFKHNKVPPPVKPKPVPLVITHSAHTAPGDTATENSTTPESASTDGSNHDAGNPLPLPPRDRTRQTVSLTKPRHQRKHPLIIPGGVTNSLLRGGGHSPALGSAAEKNEASSGRLVIQHTHNPQLESHSADTTTDTAEPANADGFNSEEAGNTPGQRLPPAKPPRLFT